MGRDPHRNRRCRWCGQMVAEIWDEELQMRRHLEPKPLPINTDLRDFAWKHRVWELQDIGWVRKFIPGDRTWREVRAVHDCDRKPRRKKKG